MTDEPSTGTISPEERFNLADRLLGLALHHLVSKFESDPGSLNASAFAEAVKLLALYQKFHADADSSNLKAREEMTELLSTLPTFDRSGPSTAAAPVEEDAEAVADAAVEEDDPARRELEQQYQAAVKNAPPILD